MIVNYSINVFDCIFKNILQVNDFIKKVEKSASLILFKESRCPKSLKKQEAMNSNSYVSVLLGVTAVICAVSCFFCFKKAGNSAMLSALTVKVPLGAIDGISIEPIISDLLSKEGCDSLLRSSTETVQFLEDNLENILFCQNTYL